MGLKEIFENFLDNKFQICLYRVSHKSVNSNLTTPSVK